MIFRPNGWILEGHHPKREKEVIEILEVGKLLVYKPLRSGEDWDTYKGEYPMWMASADNDGTGFWIHRTDQEGRRSPEGYMRFTRAFGDSNFIDALELIAPLDRWTTAVRKGRP